MDNLARLAELSKISFTDEELMDMERDMTSIIELMDTLREVALPDSDEAGDSLPLCRLRADEPRPGLQTASLLAASPEGEDFSIPKIIE